MPAELDDFLCYHSVFQGIRAVHSRDSYVCIYGEVFSDFPVKRLSFLNFVMLYAVPFTSSLGPGMPQLFFWLTKPAEGNVGLVNHSTVCLKSCGRHGRS